MLGFAVRKGQIVAVLCGNLNTQDIAENRVRGLAMVRQSNLSTIELGDKDV
jgi:hypothetical protein